jgi:hypothetical protein
MIHHEVQPVRHQIMSNLPKPALGRKELQPQTPRQYGSLVTVAQRSYSFGLLEVYGTKFASRRFLKRTARPSYARKISRTRKPCRKDLIR